MAVSVKAWWSRPASPRIAYAIAAAIGLGSVIVVYGVGFVFGTSDYWQMPALEDHRMYVMGYRYFLHEPCGWPIFDVHTAMPDTKSIAFSDTPLLWAVIHKSIATVIPPWRDYSAHAFLGLWYGVTGTLQAVFGVANLRALGHRSRGAAIATALFFIAIPAWTARFPHASLHAHFIVLWALYLYFRRASVRAQLVQLAVAALLNPYHTVMSLAVFAASLARRRAWLWFPVGCAVVAAALAVAGYFAGEASTSLSGFSAAGSNLLGPVLPMDSGWFGDRAWSDVTGLQYEGVCYLGAGLLALALLAIPRARDAATSVRRHLPLAIIAGAMAVFALSNHVYLGSHRVLAYPIPHALHWIPDQFRCPGRMSWLPMYVVAIFLLSHAFARFATGWKQLVVPALAIVQLVDVTPDWSRWRTWTRAPAETPLDATAWRRVLAASDEVEMVPAHDCNSDRSFDLATQIEYLASESAMPINGIYTARPRRDCDTDTAALLDFHPRPRTLYVFLTPSIGLARKLAAGGLPCAELAGAEVCHLDRALIDSLGSPTPPPAPLRDAIDIADAAYLELGWASAEPDGRWTDGPVARLVFRPPATPPSDPQLRIEASAMLCGTRLAQAVDVTLAGEPLGTLRFTPASNALTPARTLAVDPALLARPIVELELRPRDFRPARDVGCRRSARELGVKVRRVWIEGHSSVSP